MRITRLKAISSYITFCALIMISAHIAIPHSHGICFDSHAADTCCTSALQVNESTSKDDSHHHCMVTNIVYQQDTQKTDNIDFIALSVEHFGQIYSPIILQAEKRYNPRVPLSQRIILHHFFKKLPQRAPPAIA